MYKITVSSITKDVASRHIESGRFSAYIAYRRNPLFGDKMFVEVKLFGWDDEASDETLVEELAELRRGIGDCKIDMISSAEKAWARWPKTA